LANCNLICRWEEERTPYTLASCKLFSIFTCTAAIEGGKTKTDKQTEKQRNNQRKINKRK
jgi:hypothetical protein